MALPWCEDSALGSYSEAKRYFVAEEVIAAVRNRSLVPVVLFQHQSRTSLYWGERFFGRGLGGYLFLLGAFPYNPPAVLWLWGIKVKGMMEPGCRGTSCPLPFLG